MTLSNYASIQFLMSKHLNSPHILFINKICHHFKVWRQFWMKKWSQCDYKSKGRKQSTTPWILTGQRRSSSISNLNDGNWSVSKSMTVTGGCKIWCEIYDEPTKYILYGAKIMSYVHQWIIKLGRPRLHRSLRVLSRRGGRHPGTWNHQVAPNTQHLAPSTLLIC